MFYNVAIIDLSFCFCFKSFIVYCRINSDDDQRQLVEILVLDIFINKT